MKLVTAAIQAATVRALESALEANLTQIKIFSRASPKLTGQLVCELRMVGQALLTLFE